MKTNIHSFVLVALSASHLATALPGACGHKKAYGAASTPVKTPFEVTPEWCRAHGIGPNSPPGAGLTGKNIIEIDGKVWDGKAWWSLDAPDHASSGGYEAMPSKGYNSARSSGGAGYGQAISSSAYVKPSGKPTASHGNGYYNVYSSDSKPIEPSASRSPYGATPPRSSDGAVAWPTLSESLARSSAGPPRWLNVSSTIPSSVYAPTSITTSTLSSMTSSASQGTSSAVSSTFSSLQSSSFTSSAVSSASPSSSASLSLSSASLSSSSSIASASSSSPWSSSVASTSSSFSSLSSVASTSSSSSVSSSIDSTSSSFSSSSSIVSASSITSSAPSSTITTLSTLTSQASSTSSTQSSASSHNDPACPSGIKYAIQQVAPALYLTTTNDFFTGGISRLMSTTTTLSSAASFQFVRDSQGRCRLTDDVASGRLTGLIDNTGEFVGSHYARIYPPGALATSVTNIQESVMTCELDVLARLVCTGFDSREAPAPPQRAMYIVGGYFGIGSVLPNGATGDFIVVPVGSS